MLSVNNKSKRLKDASRPQSHTCPASSLSGDTEQDAVHGCCGYHYTASSSQYSSLLGGAEMCMSMKIKPILWYCDLAKSWDCIGSISSMWNISAPWSRWQAIKIASDIREKQQRASFKGSHAKMRKTKCVKSANHIHKHAISYLDPLQARELLYKGFIFVVFTSADCLSRKNCKCVICVKYS